jgi:phenylalanyl-tRNA synthetase beta chain
MKISVEWLKQYVDIPQSPEKLKEDLTMVGLLVESIEEADGNPVLEIEVTSNRPDCLSHIGIAREVAAFYHRSLRHPPVQERLSVASDTIQYGIEIRDADLCPRYVGLVLEGIRVDDSPEWVQRRLEAAGMRPLNNIVDITNYVLLEMGHPLHAFDFNILRQGKIVVARARHGERMQTLDGIDRDLDPEMLMINDGEGPVAIAGVMGGLNSEISQTTTRVLLESAYFAPESIRRTARKLGLSTEASYRFERGADWENTVPAIARACYLIEKLAGGRIAGSLLDIYPEKKDPVRILLHQENAAALLGVELDGDFIKSTLERLNFRMESCGENIWEVTCPTFRADMELEADLIEELARYYGYQNIPATLPPCKTIGTPSPVYALESTVRNSMVRQGYSEGVNLSFATESDYKEFPPLEPGRATINNPLTEDTQFMRTTLAPGLLRSAKRNLNYGMRLIRLFEIGKVYRPGPDGIPIERNALGILGTGGFTDQNWLMPSADYGFFHLKGVLELLLLSTRIHSFEIRPSDKIVWLNPVEAAVLYIGGEVVGALGALSPSILERYKLRQPVYLAEIDFERLATHAFPPVTYDQIPRFPFVERDMSIVVSRDLSYREIHSGITGLKIAELTDLNLIDVYEGEKIPAGKVSLTLRIKFQDREKTLTIDRVQNFVDTVLSHLKKTYGAELRSL